MNKANIEHDYRVNVVDCILPVHTALRSIYRNSVIRESQREKDDVVTGISRITLQIYRPNVEEDVGKGRNSAYIS